MQRAKSILQPNCKVEKSLFSQLATTLNNIESRKKNLEIIIANQIPSSSFTSIGQKLGNYARYLKQVRHEKPQKLPIMAG